MEKLFNFLLGPFRGNHLELIRARAFIIFSMVMLSLLALNLIAQPLLFPRVPYNIKLNLLVNCTLITIFMTSLACLRFTGNIYIPSHFIIIWTAIVFGLLTYISGGPNQSFIIWLLWIPILMAFLFLGLKSGIVWTLIIVIGYSIGLYLDHQQYDFPIALSVEQIPSAISSTWVNGLMCVFLLSLLFNYMLSKLSDKKIERRNDLQRFIEQNNSHHNIPYEIVENFIYHSVNKPDAKSKVAVITFAFEAIEQDMQSYYTSLLHELHNNLREQDIALQMTNDYFVILPQGISSTQNLKRLRSSIEDIITAHTKQSDIQTACTMKSLLYPDDSADYDELCSILRRRL